MRICVLLRGLSLFLMISSIALVITALIKERFLDRAKDVVSVGLFNLCVQRSCSSEFGDWFNGNAKPQWHAFQAFLLLETMMKVLTFVLLKKRPVWETKYANRKTILHVVLIVHMISSSIFGCIAVACYIATVNTTAGWPERNYQPSDWAMGISGLLIIIAWPISVIAYGFYCLGWRFEVEKSMIGKSDEPLLLFDGTDSQQAINQPINQSHIQLQPQQIAVNMNGQIVMATLSKSPSFNVQPTNQPTNQPLIQPVIQSTAQTVFQPFNQPMYQQNNQQYQQPTNQPVLYMPNPAMQVQPMIYGSYPQGQGPLVVMNGQPIPLQAAHQQFQTDHQSINQSINQPINSTDDSNKKDSSPMNQTIFGGEFSSSL